MTLLTAPARGPEEERAGGGHGRPGQGCQARRQQAAHAGGSRPDITKTNKPDPIPTVASLPPEPPKRNQSGYLIVLGAIAAAVIVFVLAKYRENQRPTANPRFRRAK